MAWFHSKGQRLVKYFIGVTFYCWYVDLFYYLHENIRLREVENNPLLSANQIAALQ
jgi:hypothetical protein